MSTRRILLIGGTRFIGPYVVRELLAGGDDITVFHRGQSRSAKLPAVREICDPAAGMPITQLPDELRKLEPDVVIHMMAMGRDDARAAVETFRSRAGRMVVISSCDVYLPFARFWKTEPGPRVETPLHESSPLRAKSFPYRNENTPVGTFEHYYDKIVMEGEAHSTPALPTVILRLPKVYGVEDNANLASVYGAAKHPGWRWTHGYVENVAHAIALSATHKSAAGRVYNVGEATTPTVGERLAWLPRRPASVTDLVGYDFDHDIAMDTSRIRAELGFTEIHDEKLAMQRTVATAG